MSKEAAAREAKWVVKRVMPLVPKSGIIQKRDFEKILDEIVMSVHRNRKNSIEEISGKTEKILTDLPNEYGSLPETARSWEVLVGYLYGKYLKELGHL